jgi:SSS family solute:Na+ symporter
VVIALGMVVVTLLDKDTNHGSIDYVAQKPARSVLVLWGILIVVMVALYLIFNGH